MDTVVGIANVTVLSTAGAWVQASRACLMWLPGLMKSSHEIYVHVLFWHLHATHMLMSA